MHCRAVYCAVMCSLARACIVCCVEAIYPNTCPRRDNRTHPTVHVYTRITGSGTLLVPTLAEVLAPTPCWGLCCVSCGGDLSRQSRQPHIPHSAFVHTYARAQGHCLPLLLLRCLPQLRAGVCVVCRVEAIIPTLALAETTAHTPHCVCTHIRTGSRTCLFLVPLLRCLPQSLVRVF